MRADQLVVGAVLGPTALGYYSLAWNLVIQPVAKVNPVFTRVAFPLFAKVQNESLRLQRGYMAQLWVVMLLNAPLLIGFAAIAGAVVPLIFGEKWLPAVPLVQALAFVALLQTMSNPIGSLLLALGRADLGFRWNLGRLCIQVPALYLAARLGGLEAAALSVLGLQVLYAIAGYRFLVRALLGPCLRSYLHSVLPPLGRAGVMGALVWLAADAIAAPLVVTVLLAVTSGVVIYVGLTIVFDRKRLRELKPLLVGRE